MKRAITILALMSLTPFLQAFAEPARTWKTLDGKTVQGAAIKFDFDTKTLTLETEGNAKFDCKAKDLDFPSRRMLFFSEVFRDSQSNTGEGIWRKERLLYWGMLGLSSIFLLITGMWLAGLFVARRFNPFSSVGAFLGSWIAGALLVICYLLFASKYGNAILWLGGGIAAAVIALFVSSIYRTSFIKGLLIFIGHLAFAGFLAYVLVFGSDTLFPEQAGPFWEQWIFVPTGLVEGVGAGY